MGHSAELLNRVKNLLEQDYPSSQFRYEYECGLPTHKCMRPDILIFDESDKIKCVVEIGYTRPEKLTAYKKQFKIPDVRWYDKKAELHTELEKQIIKVEVELEIASASDEARVFFVSGQVFCPDCYEEFAEDDENEEEFDELAAEDVWVHIITDFKRAVFLCFCDKCGKEWLGNIEDIESLLYELENYDSQSWRGVLGACVFRGGWNEALGHACGLSYAWNLEPKYQDGCVLRNTHLKRRNGSR